MGQLLGGVERQLRRDRVLHRPLDELRPEPVLVVGQPLARVGRLEQPQDPSDAEADDLPSSRTHVALPSSRHPAARAVPRVRAPGPDAAWGGGDRAQARGNRGTGDPAGGGAGRPRGAEATSARGEVPPLANARAPLDLARARARRVP